MATPRTSTPPPKRRRRLRFTREGKYFIALTLAIGFAAINTGNNLLYLVLGTLLALIIGSGILSEIVLRRLEVTRKPPARLFAHTPFLMSISLENSKRRFPSFTIEVEDRLASRPLERRCFFLKVPAQKTQRTSYRHTFTRRGRYHLTGFVLGTRFPFGLFEKTRTIDSPHDLLVFPQVKSLAPPRDPSIYGITSRGVRIGRTGDFHALRDYRDGDDPRDIAWKSSARLGRPLVREREEPLGHEVTIYLDNRGVELPSLALIARQEEAISRAASYAALYVTRGFRVGLLTCTASLPLGEGQAHLDAIFAALALIEFVEDGRAAPALPPGAIVVSVERPLATSLESSPKGPAPQPPVAEVA